MYRLFAKIVLFVICLSNVSYSITNQQSSYPSEPLLASEQKFLLYLNNQPIRPRERFRDDQRDHNTRENVMVRERIVENKHDNFKLDPKPDDLKANENRPPEEHYHANHHRDQRRVKFEKNLYESNRSTDNQHQWLPEQTIWRPYYLRRRVNPPPFRHGLAPFQANPMNQPMARMPPYELFPPTQQAVNPQQQQQPLMPQLDLNSRLPINNQQQPVNHHFNPVLVDNNGIFNVELVNDRFLTPTDQQPLNFGNVHIIENQDQNRPTNNELEKEQPSLEKKINDKLKLDQSNNSSEIQLINLNSPDGQAQQNFNKNSPLIELDPNAASFNDPALINTGIEQNFNFQTNSMNKNRNNNHKLGPTDPQLFINRIKQTVVTNESFIMQNPNSKPRLEEKSNLITNLNETTKILDTSPQQYSPVHFRQTFQQIQAQQKENQRFAQFTPLLYSSNQQVIKSNQPQMLTTKSSLDVVQPPQIINQHINNPSVLNGQLYQTSPSPNQSPSISPYSTPNLIKRLQQQQLQNALLARLGSHNGNLNTIEAARRMRDSLGQERANRERVNAASTSNSLSSNPSANINSSPSMDASKSNAKEFFTRRTNTHRYVIVTVLLTAIIVISIGITVIYVKQRRLNLHSPQGSGNGEIGSSYGIRKFYQRSPSSSNTPSDSDSYGPSYLSNRSVATSVETRSTTGPKTLSTLRTANVMHR